MVSRRSPKLPLTPEDRERQIYLRSYFGLQDFPSHIRRVPHSSLLTISSPQAILLFENETQFHLARQNPSKNRGIFLTGS